MNLSLYTMPRLAKGKAQKGGRRSGEKSDLNHISDPRFASIQTSALYRLPSKKHAQFKLDSRFSHVLHDERFVSTAKVDRYGRRLQSSKGVSNLKKLYRAGGESPAKDNFDDDVTNEDEVRDELSQVAGLYDPARNGGFSESSSSEDSYSESESEPDREHVEYPDSQGTGIVAGEASNRLAIVNLDWDNIRAIDLMAVFSSFIGEENIIDISIYPSDFGKERMEKEELEGPPKEIFKSRNVASKSISSSSRKSKGNKNAISSTAEPSDISTRKLQEGEEFDANRLRHYQIERLRYFFAVLTCSSPLHAQTIYDTLDGTEYLSTANFFDLRFVPSEMSFVAETARDSCNKVLDNYRPNDFVTDALQHSKVKLTWDTDDKGRKEAQRRAFASSRVDFNENDLKAYLGSDNSESEDGKDIHDSNLKLADQGSRQEKERSRIRELLGLKELHSSKLISGSKALGDMQVTFTAGLSEQGKVPVFQNEPDIDESTIDAYVRKERDRRARRKSKHKQMQQGSEIHAAEAQSEQEIQVVSPDLGFDDPFFANPSQRSNKFEGCGQHRGNPSSKKKANFEAESAAERAELELLMLDDRYTSRGIGHFDMTEIERGEKARSKKRKSKLTARDREAVAAIQRDGFKININDQRFRAVFENSDFAVDPNHSRYRSTDGMRALLKESRRKRTLEGNNETSIHAVKKRL